MLFREMGKMWGGSSALIFYGVELDLLILLKYGSSRLAIFGYFILVWVVSGTLVTQCPKERT